MTVLKSHFNSPTGVVIAWAAWMTSVGNAPLWRKLAALGFLQTAGGVAFVAAMALVVFGALVAVLGIFAWRWTLRPAIYLLLVITAASGYFMFTYGIVMDPGMMTNAVQTDLHEAVGLLSWRLVATMIFAAAIPIGLLWRQPISWGSGRHRGINNLLMLMVGLLIALIAAMASFQTMASVMRNNKDVRYLINPLAAVYSATRAAMRPFERDDSVLVRIGEDARISQAAVDRGRPAILLLVLGETARSANFSINGYARPTTPNLEREGALSFRNAWACGTSTAASVPCMFSNMGRDRFDDRRNSHEGLLDVLQRAGLAVLWVDNQSGCKGVCNRVPTVSTAKSKSPLCAGDECLDGVMLEGLDDRIAMLDPERVKRGLVLVMHQMGSHGPDYHLRSPASLKHFKPECTSAALNECSHEGLVNAYDNSIAYTDHFLGLAIAWLKKHSARADTAMLYVSDHGESLGENNLYLHGMPYAVAPDVQKHVPWITWMSEGYLQSTALSLRCLQSQRERRISHDNYFHAVLGFMEVETTAYESGLDPYALCRGRLDRIELVNLK